MAKQSRGVEQSAAKRGVADCGQRSTEGYMISDESKVKIDVDFIKIAKRAAGGYGTLVSESDRGCALVGASMIDGTISCLLRCFFIDEKRAVDGLMAQGRPLSTFSSRIDLCRAIGLISQEMYLDLNTVRKIRNAAAHFDPEAPAGHEFSFSDPQVADRCRSLATCPTETRNSLLPRMIFQQFVGTVSAIFAEYARNSRIATDFGAHSLGRKMLLELLPTADFKGYLLGSLKSLWSDDPK